MQLSVRSTKTACYVGYVTQAILNNLSPLLFLTFQREFSVSLSQISLIITLNFFIQMTVDLLSARFVDKLGYRPCVIAAHILSVAGLCCLSLLPGLVSPYFALLFATALCAIGGGLLEVLVSPIIEALPVERKESEMSLLHSFYCWGQVGVVLLSTGYFLLFGTENWRILPLIWALIPLANTFLFARVPLWKLTAEGEGMRIFQLCRLPVFWLMMLLMLCAGACEMAMSQWASLFAEMGLQVSKTVGDLLGPCAFAGLMGLARLLFGRAKKIKTETALLVSGILCMCCYLVTVLSPWPLLALLGCAVCGFSVGVMWPGTFSVAAANIPKGGTALFALLALAGDVGCCSGPTVVGLISDSVIAKGSSFLNSLLPVASLSLAALKSGFLLALIFPVLLCAGILMLQKQKKKI